MQDPERHGTWRTTGPAYRGTSCESAAMSALPVSQARSGGLAAPAVCWLSGRLLRGQPPPAVVTGQLVGPRGFGAAARGGYHRGEDGRLGRGAHRLRVSQVGPAQAVADPPG